MQILPSLSPNNLFKNLRPQPKTTQSPFTGATPFPSEKSTAAYKLEEELSITTPSKRRLFNWRTFFMALFGLGFVIFTVLASVALSIDVDRNPSLVSKLRMANTALDRLNLLPRDSDWLFDFTQQDKYTFTPGGVVNANAATFPATVGHGMTMAMLNLGACSMLPPHFHPRASNYVVAVAGKTQTYMIMENGARTVTETLTPGKMTIFPAASVHTMQNVGCENAQLVSALNFDDAGTHNIANALFGLPSEIVGPVVGMGVNETAVQASVPKVGTGSNPGSAECLKRCRKRGVRI
ncbi:MAG: hypothetical protein Q9160_006575 [Pyrenula sp. 1 TL-2023]